MPEADPPLAGIKPLQILSLTTNDRNTQYKKGRKKNTDKDGDCRSRPPQADSFAMTDSNPPLPPFFKVGERQGRDGDCSSTRIGGQARQKLMLVRNDKNLPLSLFQSGEKD